MHMHFMSVWALVLVTHPLALQTSAPTLGHRITVIGCVARSQPDVAGTTGTTAINAEETRYVLDHIALAADPAQTAVGDLIAERVSMYQLDDRNAPTLAAHVGEKVEITGTVGPPRQSSQVTKPADAVPAPILRIEKVRALGSASSASCRS